MLKTKLCLVTGDNLECGNRWSLQINPDPSKQTINNNNTIQRKLITSVSPAQPTIKLHSLSETTNFKEADRSSFSSKCLNFCDKLGSSKSRAPKNTIIYGKYAAYAMRKQSFRVTDRQLFGIHIQLCLLNILWDFR